MADPLSQDDSGIDVVNAPRDLWGDLYHELLRAPWWLALTSIAAGTWIDMDGRYADERLVITRVHVRPEPARYVEIDGPLTGRGPGKGAFQVSGP